MISKKPAHRIKFLAEPTDDWTPAVVRREDGAVQTGLVRQVVEGRPINEGDRLISIDVDDSEDDWNACATLYERPRTNGPPQVATRAYCAGYERIFGKKQVGLA